MYLSVKEVENVGVEEAAVRHAVLPQGSSQEDPEWGRRPQEGEKAEGHPSLSLLDYLICTPDPKLVCLKIPAGKSYLPI